MIRDRIAAMGQVALGFRSLLVRLAVFFVMAALLAWALGGTLFPRAETANLFSVTAGEQECFWQVSVGGRVNGQTRWSLCLRRSDGPVQIVDNGDIVDVAGPAFFDDGFIYAARRTGSLWEIRRLTSDGSHQLLGSAADRHEAVSAIVHRVGRGGARADAEHHGRTENDGND